MDLGLAGRCAIVSGSSQGIGLAIARVLASEGANVVLCARTPEALAAATRELSDLPGCVTSACVDLATPSGAADVRDTALQAFARIDILVNNAGVYDFLAFEEVDDAAWERIFALNLMAAVRLSRLIAPLMRAQGWGRIVNVLSEAAAQPDTPMPHYAASKAALANFTKALSREFGRDGVLVNAVSPGPTRSPTLERFVEAAARAAGLPVQTFLERHFAETRPSMVLRRLAEPEEVGYVVAFLCSERASFVTGANVHVDGGAVGVLL